MADEVKDPRAAGWKRDPSGRFAGRYWDGTGWTEHVVGHDRVTSTDPIPRQEARPIRSPTMPARAATTAPTGTRATRPAPAAPTPGRGWPAWTKLALPIAAVLVVVGVVISFDRRDQAGTTRAATPARNTRTYAVGASARSGDFDITVFGVKDPQPPGEFLRPDVGKRLLSADVQVTNRSTGTQGFSSLLGFHLVDSETHEYDISFGEIQPPAPDGDIAPGESLRGFVVFEVPDAARGFRFRAAGSLTAAEVVFALA